MHVNAKIIEDYIKNYIKQQSGHSELEMLPTTNFIEEGLLDSFAILSLIMNLESRFAIKFQPKELTTPAAKTICGLVEIVSQKHNDTCNPV